MLRSALADSDLTKRVEEYGHKNKFEIIDFEVDKENYPSIKMHSKLGYSILETNEMDNYIMRKIL